MPSDGCEEAVAPRVPPVPSKPTQAEQDEHNATGHAAYRSWFQSLCQRSWTRVTTQCLCSSFPCGWLRGLGWKRLLLSSDSERASLAFLRAAAMGLEGVDVIEQACPQGDHGANGLAEVAVREAKAQTGVLKSHLSERLKRPLSGLSHWQHSEFGIQQTACKGTESKQMGRRQINCAQENVGDVKLSSLKA